LIQNKERFVLDQVLKDRKYIITENDMRVTSFLELQQMRFEDIGAKYVVLTSRSSMEKLVMNT
jgi:hypothetical protein